MQAAVMQPPQPQYFPMPSPQQSTFPATDPSSSVSSSTYPPPRPPTAPTYASLSYPPGSSSSSGPSPHLASNGWYTPSYYPAPNFRPPGGDFPYPDPTYQQYGNYGPNGYYPPSYPQMGGPGPGTMQNGYGGYTGNYPIQIPAYGPRGFDLPPPAEGMNGDPQFAPGQDAISHHPPFSPDGRPNHPPYPTMHHEPRRPPPSSSNPPYNTQYPPNHPYAYGGRFGYPPQIPGPDTGYPTYNGFPDIAPRNSLPPRMPSGIGKGLNPAAQGFNLSIQPRPPPDQHTGLHTLATSANGVGLSSNRGSTSAFLPNITPLQLNGSAGPNGLPLPPVPQTSQSSSDHAPAVSPSGGPSTAQSVRQTSESPSLQSSVPTSAVMTQTAPTPALSSPPTTPTTTASLHTPRAIPGCDPLIPTSPKPASPVAVGQWSFVGPPVLGYISPPSAVQPSLSQALAGQPVSASLALSMSSRSQRKRATFSTDTGILKLRSRRPDVHTSAGNSYASWQSSTIPKTVKVERVSGSLELPPRIGVKGKSNPSRKHPIFTVGIKGQSVSPSTGFERRHALVFGSLALDGTDSLLCGPAEAPRSEFVVPAPMAPSADVLETSKSEATTPLPGAPPLKPSSWAALLKAPSRSLARSVSVPTGAFSVNNAPHPPSPTLSMISIQAESEVGPSRRPVSPPNVPTTPQPGPRPGPPASTGVLGPARPRPAFNYAAAAAVGAQLTPQDELVKLLTEGLKGKREPPVSMPRGLINTGNMCFANTILQVLVYCPSFADLFEELGRRLKADLARRTPLLEAMIIFLREFTVLPAIMSGTSTPRSEPNGAPNRPGTPKGKTRDTRRDAFIPENVYDAMKENKRFDSMRRGYQEDAEEYLGFFLNTLHEELLYLLSRTQPSRPSSTSRSLANGHDDQVDQKIQRPVSPGVDNDGEGWLEVGKKQKTNVVRNTESRESAVSRLFGGTLRSVLHTPGQKDSVTLEPYQPLQLDVQSPEVLDVVDALRHLSEPEIVPGVWSASRRENVDATKQVYIESFPPVLILHMKRFVYDPMEQNVVKKSKAVAYGTELAVPPEIISPARRTPGATSGIKYRLFGIVFHHGTSASGGHYTVAVSRQDHSGWLHFDDELVTSVPTEQVVVSKEEAESGRSGLIGGREKVAYLLFYQRVRA